MYDVETFSSLQETSNGLGAFIFMMDEVENDRLLIDGNDPFENAVQAFTTPSTISEMASNEPPGRSCIVIVPPRVAELIRVSRGRDLRRL